MPLSDEQRVVWDAQDGSQKAFLISPVYETLLEGNRGGGKTDALLMDFAQDVGQGWGNDWSGWIFRRTMPELEDIITKSIRWFTQMFPPGTKHAATYNKNKHEWNWASGEKLTFTFADDPKDYWRYHGHGRPWIGWEELTSWADDYLYRALMSCCRSSRPGIPRKIRSTTNPYGPGHNWVKTRWRLPTGRGQIIKDSIDPSTNKPEPHRLAIYSRLSENKVLLVNDPNYLDRIRAAAENEAQLQAWIEGSWDISSGGMFDDVWNPRYHVVAPFIPPPNWYIDRAYDWGSSKPFWVGWFAESDGSDLLLPNGRHLSTVRGDLFLFKEWYGWNGQPNKGVRKLDAEIAQGITKREIDWGIQGRVGAGPADSSIFDPGSGGQGISIADEMEKRVTVYGRSYPGVQFQKADKGPGSRKSGWQNMRARLKDAVPPILRKDAEGKPITGPREKPGLFICSTCEQWLRTVPSLPRQPDDMDDVDTEAEDHPGDGTRYRCHNPPRRTRVSTVHY